MRTIIDVKSYPLSENVPKQVTVKGEIVWVVAVSPSDYNAIWASMSPAERRSGWNPSEEIHELGYSNYLWRAGHVVVTIARPENMECRPSSPSTP